MAKRSYIKDIRSKRSGAYRDIPRTPAAIHALPKLKGWPPAPGISESMQDEQAERRMNPQGWSARKNPICPICQVQKSITGECYC